MHYVGVSTLTVRILKPVYIGPIRLNNPIILAPMSGVTDMPYRRLVKRHGAGLVVSEMIASRAMVSAARKAVKKMVHVAEEYPTSVQLAGCDPKIMAEAAQLNRSALRVPWRSRACAVGPRYPSS
mgnify:CR=1 FL=1